DNLHINIENTNLWIGQYGVTAQCHYDASDNFYIQLQGKKRFVMFPPEANQNLYLYSAIHSMNRRSQFNFEETMEKQRDNNADLDGIVNDWFSGVANLTASVAILEPGDVLYMPPFWFHHVTALGYDPPSLSYNMWSDLSITNDIKKHSNVAIAPFVPHGEGIV